MGKANLYTVKDYQTGEVLAKGTAGELEASGIVPKGYHTSEWAKHENQKRRNRKYAISFEERQPEVKRGEKGRMMSVYTCYNAAGDVIGEGTARELWEAGVFSNDNAAYYTYKEQGGRCIKRGIAKIGKLAGVRFIETSEAKIWTGSGCPSGLAVFGTLVLAAHAYAVTEVEGGGLQHIVKQLGAGEDPLNQRASVGWKAIKTAERLCEQYMVRIESISPKYSAKAKAN